jgi:hypothetical protein
MSRRERSICLASVMLFAGLVLGCTSSDGERGRTPSDGERRRLDAWLACEECAPSLLDSVVAIGHASFTHGATVRYLLAAAAGPGDTAGQRRYEAAMGARYARDSASAAQRMRSLPAGWPTRDEWVGRLTANIIAGMQIRAATALSRIGGGDARAALDSLATLRLRADVAQAVANLRRGVP